MGVDGYHTSPILDSLGNEPEQQRQHHKDTQHIMLYDFRLWRDDSQELVLDFLTNTLKRLRTAAIDLGQDKYLIQELDAQIEDLEGATYLRDLSCEFRIPRTDDSSWHNTVRVRVEIEEDHRFYKEVKLAKKERRGVSGQRYSPKVKCDPHIGGDKPADAVRFARLLAEIAKLTMEIDGDLEVMLRRVGNFPIDEAKEKADNDLRNRRNFISDAIGTALHDEKGYTETHVRNFVKELIAEHFKTEEGLTRTVTKRFEGKERKLLNKVPSSVFKVKHVRGGDSTVTLTPKAMDCISLEMKETAEKEAREAKAEAA